ncbi:MAG: zinc-ribbon domain-containing protein [Oscillospiraceae bacterium]|jgi:hypothetical protein|nr:zinc-ribbon domain-containing protein [Oscillospiraceae bacterium]
MKFCPKCGRELADNLRFCDKCGAEVGASSGNPAAKTSALAYFKSKINIKIVAAFAAVVLLIIIISSASGGYKKPVDRIIKAMNTGKGSYVIDTMPDAYVDYLLSGDSYYSYYYDVENLSDLKKYYDDIVKGTRESLGEKVKISYKITDKERLDKDDIDKIEENMEDDIEKNVKISKAYELTVKLTIKGKDLKASNEVKMRVIKIGGKWYLDPDTSPF